MLRRGASSHHTDLPPPRDPAKLARTTVDPELVTLALAAPLRVLWRFGTQAGHAYVSVGENVATWLELTHSPETTPVLLTLLERWQARHDQELGALERLRASTSWHPPGRAGWSFVVDAGALETLLRGRTLATQALLGPARNTELPESFLREPVRASVRALLGDVHWPPELDARAVRPEFRHTREGDVLALTACRYDSKHRDAGQDRTAAIWLSRDAGASFSELPWRLPLRQRVSAAGQFCWPPEQIDGVFLERVDGELSPTIEWEDPWIAFEPGSEWRARFVPSERHWVMQER